MKMYDNWGSDELEIEDKKEVKRQKDKMMRKNKKNNRIETKRHKKRMR